MLMLSSMAGGGAERVAVNLLRRCDPAAVDLRIGLLRRAGPYLNEVDPAKLVASPGEQAWLSYDSHASSLYRPDRLLAGAVLGPRNIARMIRDVRPEVVMSFSKGVNVLTALVMAGLGKDRPRWICREENNAEAVISDEVRNALGRRVVTGITGRAYRSADVLLAVANDLSIDLERQLRLDRRRIRVIHNPIDLASIERLSASPLADAPPRPFIVAAGRLEYQKGFDLLIRAFARGRARHTHDLVILGQGGQEQALRTLAAQLGVAAAVRFPGFQANPWSWFAKAALFVLPSRWEGFGNVVAEALACGAPTVVTDCNYGPREQVEHDVSGLVARSEDVDALQAAIDRVIGDPQLAARLSAEARVRARAFDLDAIARAFTELFLEQAMLRRQAGIAERAPSPAPALDEQAVEA